MVCLLCVLVAQSCPTLCNPIHRLEPARLLCPSDSPSENTGMGCHLVFQGILDLPDAGIELGSPALQPDSFTI